LEHFFEQEVIQKRFTKSTTTLQRRTFFEDVKSNHIQNPSFAVALHFYFVFARFSAPQKVHNSLLQFELLLFCIGHCVPIKNGLSLFVQTAGWILKN